MVELEVEEEEETGACLATLVVLGGPFSGLCMLLRELSWFLALDVALHALSTLSWFLAPNGPACSCVSLVGFWPRTALHAPV